MAIGTGAAVEVLAILSPHLHRAFATHTRLTQLRCQNAELCQSVKAIGLAVISCGCRWTIAPGERRCASNH